MKRLAAFASALAAFAVFATAARGETNVLDRARVDFAEEATLEAFAVPAVEHAEEATLEVFAVPAVEHAEASQIEADPVVPAQRLDEHPAWHDRIEAEKGSRAYWILYAAREKARCGESTDALAAEFVQTLARWMAQ